MKDLTTTMTSTKWNNKWGFILIVFSILLSSCCISHYEYQTKDVYNHNVDFTLSIKKDKFVLYKDGHQYFESSYGILIKESNDVFCLNEAFSKDSMEYIVSYRNVRDSNYTFYFEAKDLFFNKLIINDTVFIDNQLSYNNMKQLYSCKLNSKPKSLKLESYVGTDMVFNKDRSLIKSKRYIVPDTCNYMKISYNFECEGIIGTRLLFNVKTGELYSDSNKFVFKKVSHPSNKKAEKSNVEKLNELLK